MPNAPNSTKNKNLYINEFMRQNGTFDNPIPKDTGFIPLRPLQEKGTKPKTKEEIEKIKTY